MDAEILASTRLALPVPRSSPADIVTVANERVWDKLSIATLVVTGVLVLLTFRDYGVTWDSDLHNLYGVRALDYYLSRFTDTQALTLPDLHYYGALFDLIAAGLNRISPLGIYETRHLLNAAFGIFGLAGCW